MDLKKLDDRQRHVSELRDAIAAVEDHFGSLTIQREDPYRIERAILEMEAAVDRKLACYWDNSMVEHFSEQIKAQFRERIRMAAKETE